MSAIRHPANRETPLRRRIWFLGDSLTAGYDASSAQNTFVALFRQAYAGDHPSFVYHSANLYGGRISDGLRQAKAEASFNPDVAVLQFGENDRPWTTGFREAYQGLILELYRAGRHPLVAAFSVWDPSGNDSAKMDPDIRELVAEAGGVFVDISQAAAEPAHRQAGRDVSWLNDPQHLTSDSFHPNDAGHDRMAEVLLAALKEILKSPVARDTASGRVRVSGRPRIQEAR